MTITVISYTSILFAIEWSITIMSNNYRQPTEVTNRRMDPRRASLRCGSDGEPLDPHVDIGDGNVLHQYAIKPLDSHFASLGEAVFSFVNCGGYGNNKRFDIETPSYFCEVLGIPFNAWSTDPMDFSRYYFKDLDWLFKHIDENDWIRVGLTDYAKVDEFNRPIAYITHSNGMTGAGVSVKGSLDIVTEVMKLAKSNIVFDDTVPYATNYVEVGIRRDGSNPPPLVTLNGTIKHNRVSLPEYYPYLDGGIDALIKDFMESDETVLILMGPPGTGKSTAVMSAAKSLGLRPIYANNAEVISNPDFVSYVFRTLDQYMDRFNDPIHKRNSLAYNPATQIDRNNGMDPYKVHRVEQDPYYGKSPEEIDNVYPLIVIEDGDALMAPRKGGNLVMNNLLNQTDGVSSSVNRKIIFNTNLKDVADIDEGLLRPGRCYTGAPINFRLLTIDEAIIARKAAGLPDFVEVPQKAMSLAEALLKPRQKIVLEKPKPRMGFSL